MEDGFYWAKWKAGGEWRNGNWTILENDNGFWTDTGTECCWSTADIEERFELGPYLGTQPEIKT